MIRNLFGLCHCSRPGNRRVPCVLVMAAGRTIAGCRARRYREPNRICCDAHPGGCPFAGRMYAAYRGIYIAASFVWLLIVEEQRPSATDIVVTVPAFPLRTARIAAARPPGPQPTSRTRRPR